MDTPDETNPSDMASSDEAAEAGAQTQPFDEEPQVSDDFAVLEAFGLKLEVSNPRLAQLLTMDAKTLLTMDGKTALTTDVMDLPSVAQEMTDTVQRSSEADLDVVLSAPTARDEEEERQRREMRAEVASLGETLGFDSSGPGLWHSPADVKIIVRVVDKPVSFATASHFVSEIADRRVELGGQDATALFVVESQQTADVFKVAIRQRQVYHLMRTVSVANLRSIGALAAAGSIEHSQSLVLLAPIADIDVGEVLAILRSTGADANVSLE